MSVEKDTGAEEISQEISQAEEHKNEANEYFKSAYAYILILMFFSHRIQSAVFR